MIFPNSYDPYGSLESEEINEQVTGDSNEHEHKTDSKDMGSTEDKEPSKDSVSYHIENRKKILEERIKNESSINLISFGIIAGVGILILKRYL